MKRNTTTTVTEKPAYISKDNRKNARAVKIQRDKEKKFRNW